MHKSNWLVGSAIVFVALAIALTFDPFGFFEAGEDEPIEQDYATAPLTDTGLKGRGRAVLPDADPATWEGDPVGTLVLDLGTAALEGSVTASDAPLRFARVHPVLPPPHDRVAVRTGKDGRYVVRGLPDGQHEVRATAAGHLGRTVVAPLATAGQTVEVEPIDLPVRLEHTDAIVVRVTDLFGRPIPGAKVLATTMPWDLHLIAGPALTGTPDVLHRSGTTDERGRVRLGPLQPEDYNVVASASGYVNMAVNGVQVTAGRDRQVLLRLPEGVSVRGRVEDLSTGAPIEGAMVMGMAQPSFVSSLSARTGADGSFVLDGLRRGGYMFMAYDEKGGQAMTSGAAPGTITIKLEGMGRLRGTVVWSDGRPVTEGHVRPFQAGPFQYVYSQVHPLQGDGTFDIRLPKGTYNVRVQAAGGELTDDVKATVAVGETAEVKVTLPATGVVRGVVMDEEGRHVEGAEIFVMKGGFPESPSREQYARSDPDGAFEVPGLPLSPLKLHVVHPGYADTKIDVSPSLPAQATEVSVRLLRGARVVGSVRDASGAAVDGEQVNLIVNWFSARSTFTGGDGSFVFDAVAPGTYSMTTGPYEQGARGLSKSDIRVGLAGDVVVEFESPAATGRLTGEVVQAGAPVPGAAVTIQDARGAEAAVRVQTDATGRFAAEGLQLGRVLVTAKTASGLTASERARVTDADPAAHVVVEVGSASVQIRTVDGEGLPVAGCWINVEVADPKVEGWGRVKANGNTDSDGVFTSAGLQEGTYILRVNRVEYAQVVTPPFTLTAGATKNLGDLRLTRGAVLSGLVVDDAGAPVEKATVSLKDETGRPVFLFSMATTGSDGRYALHGVEPGRYTVRFEASGHGPYEAVVEISAAGATADGALARGGAVTVQVEDEAGVPLEGVRITLIDERGQAVTKTISLANFDSGRRTTGADGRATLSDLAAGTFTVRCERSGYAMQDDGPRVFVRAGETASTRIVLQATE